MNGSNGAARRVFVIDPFRANGGTYMAYHIVRILHQEYGFTPVAVVDDPNAVQHGVFPYDLTFPRISVTEMERTITDRDVLQANAGHSRFVFGPRLPGRKIMYVQSFTTAAPLDCGYDAYVAVSAFVQRYLRSIYEIDAPAIAPFIEPEKLAPGLPWSRRAPDSAIVHAKGYQVDLGALRQSLTKLGSEIALRDVIPLGLSRFELSKRVGAARFFVTVSPAEGFGLVPLEAMAVGTAVLGFDGFGGREYLVDGVNCGCVPYGDFDGLARRIIRAFASERIAERYRDNGRATAAEYTYDRFRAAWCAQLDAFLRVRA